MAEEPIAAIHSGDEGKQISQRWIGFSEDDAQANRRRRGYQATEPLDFQRVEDNVFHLWRPNAFEQFPTFTVEICLGILKLRFRALTPCPDRCA